MPTVIKLVGLAALFVLPLSSVAQLTPLPEDVPRYTADGQLQFPAHYREWVFLTSGFDMSYRADAAMPGHHMFDNVFVGPDAYAAFVKTGSWPDLTMLVLEHREARSKGSINRQGSFQTAPMDVEVHVKDARRYAGKWAFFGFAPGDRSGSTIPHAAACYSCHFAHGAVDTTFVQFYPTLLPVAKAHATDASE